MHITIKPGKYVVAVSGGVDSMVLLHLLAQKYQSPVTSHQSSSATEDRRLKTDDHAQLVVAHFDHGIRPDSLEDSKLVKEAARRYGLPFAAAHGNLGPDASEAAARKARYDFLDHVMAEEGADGIITAHHQDDVLETAIINLLRGTGRLGLSSLRSKERLVRPLLDYTKEDIRHYATEHGLTWREDSTNADDRHLRNYIRHHVLTRLGEKGRAVLIERINQGRDINEQIDALLHKDLDLQPAVDQLRRSWFVKLPYAVAREVMAMWLRRNGILNFNRQLIKRLVEFALTKEPGKKADIDSAHMLASEKDGIRLIDRPNENRSRNPNNPDVFVG